MCAQVFLYIVLFTKFVTQTLEKCLMFRLLILFVTLVQQHKLRAENFRGRTPTSNIITGGKTSTHRTTNQKKKKNLHKHYLLLHQVVAMKDLNI